MGTGLEWIALAVSSVGTTAVTATALYVGTYALAYGAISIGLNLLASSLFAPSTPKPEDVQQQTKQTASARLRHYGKVAAGQQWVFADAKNGAFHKVLAIGQGPITAIDEIWIDDEIATINSSGYVTSSTDTEGNTRSRNSKIRLLTRLGTETQTAYSELTSYFPTWTSSHIGKGVASIYALQIGVKSEQYSKQFPNGINTSYKAIIRGCAVENPSTLVTEYSENAAIIIRDYLYNEFGMRLPYSLLTTTQATAGWIDAMNKCGAPITLAAGGTEMRWRICNSYQMDERPADVLSRFLKVCDGRMKLTNDGGLMLDVVGESPTVNVTLDSSAITGFTSLSRGKNVLESANVIRATYTDPNSLYTTSDADPWEDEADIALRGEIPTDVELLPSPSHRQTRALMKLEAYRALPNWQGTFTCNMRGIKAFNERFVHIQYKFGIDEVFEILNFQFNFGDNGICTGCTIQVQSMPASAYQWDSSQEGTSPSVDFSNGQSTIPDVTNFSATIIRKEVNSQLYPYARLSFDDSTEDSLTTEARGKLVSDTDWTSIAVAQDATTADSFLLSDGGNYEFQVRYVAYSSQGNWSSSVYLTATADPTAPGVITALVVTPDNPNDSVDMSWQSPNSSNFAATKIYRNTSNTFTGSTLIHTEYGAANFPFTYKDASGTGTFYYFFKTMNYSGVESAAVASGAIVVT